MRLFLKKASTIIFVKKKKRKKEKAHLLTSHNTWDSDVFGPGLDWIGVAGFQYGVPRRPSEHGDDGRPRAGGE